MVNAEAPSPVAIYVVGSPMALKPTPLSFPTPSPVATVFVEPANTTVPFGINRNGNTIEAFIHAPAGVQMFPYVVLTAFESQAGADLEMRGYINLIEFVCTGSPCKVPLTESAVIIFKAYNARGDASDEVQARVRVEQKDDGYLVIVDSVNQLTLYQDSCSNIWDIRDELEEPWSRFPQNPFQLNTGKKLHLLASRLIMGGIVDASECPGGGLIPGSDTPTGCGIEKANSKMIEWQNQFDFSIWSAGMEVGIPPRILKTIIEYESQYWPSNQRVYVDEIGLGQINQLGIDVLLLQDPSLFQKICPKILANCEYPYSSLDKETQALVRGAVLDSVNAECVTCLYGLDLDRANQSIPLIAQLVKANCEMVDRLDVAKSTAVNYDDLWKFTLVSYHSGFGCIRDAVDFARKAGEPLDWEHVSFYLNCRGAERYVNGFWSSLLSFDSYLLERESLPLVQVNPTFVPTRTPLPPPTEIPSTAQVWVRVYMDDNGNGLPDPSEWLDGIDVELAIPRGQPILRTTRDGQVIFDMTGYPVGLDAIVRLPGLYREKLIKLPEAGLVQLDFVFIAPDFPIQIP